MEKKLMHTIQREYVLCVRELNGKPLSPARQISTLTSKPCISYVIVCVIHIHILFNKIKQNRKKIHVEAVRIT